MSEVALTLEWHSCCIGNAWHVITAIAFAGAETCYCWLFNRHAIMGLLDQQQAAKYVVLNTNWFMTRSEWM